MLALKVNVKASTVLCLRLARNALVGATTVVVPSKAPLNVPLNVTLDEAAAAAAATRNTSQSRSSSSAAAAHGATAVA